MIWRKDPRHYQYLHWKRHDNMNNLKLYFESKFVINRMVKVFSMALPIRLGYKLATQPEAPVEDPQH